VTQPATPSLEFQKATNYLPLAIAFGGSAFGMFMSTVFAEPTERVS